MSNFLTLQTRVQTRIIDLPSAVLAEIPTLINEAIGELEAIHNFQVMKKEKEYITSQTASNSHVIGQIPSDWKEPRGNPYYVLQFGSVREFNWAVNRTFAYRQFDPFDTNTRGSPALLLVGEATNDTVPDPSNPDLQMINLNVEVYPYPDGLSDWSSSPGGEYRINVPYWGYVPTLVNNTDMNWFTENATGFIIDYATARGFMLDWDEQRASVWYMSAWGPKYDGSDLSTVGGFARRVLNKDKSISYAPGKVLTPRRDVYGDTNQWRQ